MKNLELHYEDVEKKIAESDGCLLMLDFDGTLSPIASTPDKAILPKSTQRILKALTSHLPVAIVSGRLLDDIRKRVESHELIYAGSHGMEWQIHGQIGHVTIPKETLEMLQTAKLGLAKLPSEFPGMLLEDKRLSLAIHYRLIRPSQAKAFRTRVMETIRPFLKNDLELIEGKKVFELRPEMNWTKGHFAEFIVRHLEQGDHKRLLPIYVGDDTTDEDAFKRLRNGVTVRVGKKFGSAADYYLKDQGMIDHFLNWIHQITKNSKT